jgi:hypothetical protein
MGVMSLGHIGLVVDFVEVSSWRKVPCFVGFVWMYVWLRDLSITRKNQQSVTN